MFYFLYDYALAVLEVLSLLYDYALAVLEVLSLQNYLETLKHKLNSLRSSDTIGKLRHCYVKS